MYQISFNIGVWAGVIENIVVGSYLLPDRLTAQRYLDFLENIVPGLLQDVLLAMRQRLWFQHAGESVHLGEDVRGWLKVTYPGKLLDAEDRLHGLLGRRI
jgi:hypothetical protein